jgi:EAL domain-containing protein (putative c-di-GMP-specific phosphodiesterase class I)
MPSSVPSFLEQLARHPETDKRLWLDTEQRVVGKFLRCQLASVFQPIIDLNEQTSVAREAFVRSWHQTESRLSPWSLFASAAHDDDVVELDRLCRTVHLLNHFSGLHANESLIVNVHDRLLAAVAGDHGRSFRRVLDALAIPPSRVIIETPESVCLDRGLLAFVVANYRLNGFRISVSVGRVSDVQEALGIVRPDYLKVDGRRITSTAEAAHILALAEANCVRTIIQRVETHEQLNTLREAGITLVQGFALAAPSAVPAQQTPLATTAA